MKHGFPLTLEEKYAELCNQCASIRDLIPSVVAGQDTSSVASSPMEVLYFTELYLKELSSLRENNGKNKKFKIKYMFDEDWVKYAVIESPNMVTAILQFELEYKNRVIHIEEELDDLYFGDFNNVW